MIAARFVEALGELAAELVRGMPAPRALGSEQGNVTRGLVPCSTCNTMQSPRGVHFASNTDIRPCAGSWRRR